MAEDPNRGDDNKQAADDQRERLRQELKARAAELAAKAEAEKNASQDPTHTIAGLRPDEMGPQSQNKMNPGNIFAPVSQQNRTAQTENDMLHPSESEYSGNNQRAQKAMYDAATSGQGERLGGVAVKTALSEKTDEEKENKKNRELRDVLSAANISYEALRQSFTEYTQEATQQISHCEAAALEIKALRDDIILRTQEAKDNLQAEKDKLKDLAEQMVAATESGDQAKVARLQDEITSQAIKVGFAQQNYDTHQDISESVALMLKESREEIDEIRSDMQKIELALQNGNLNEEQRAELKTELDEARDRIREIGRDTRERVANAHQAAELSTNLSNIAEAHVGKDGATNEALMALTGKMVEFSRDGKMDVPEIRQLETMIKADPSLAAAARDMGSALYTGTKVGIKAPEGMDRDAAAIFWGQELKKIEDEAYAEFLQKDAAATVAGTTETGGTDGALALDTPDYSLAEADQARREAESAVTRLAASGGTMSPDQYDMLKGQLASVGLPTATLDQMMKDQNVTRENEGIVPDSGNVLKGTTNTATNAMVFTYALPVIGVAAVTGTRIAAPTVSPAPGGQTNGGGPIGSFANNEFQESGPPGVATGPSKVSGNVYDGTALFAQAQQQQPAQAAPGTSTPAQLEEIRRQQLLAQQQTMAPPAPNAQSGTNEQLG